MIMAFVYVKTLLSCSVHMKRAFGFSSARNGCILSADANAYETWLTRPNQLLMSVMFCGVGKFLIASSVWGHGRTLSGEISNPANVTVSFAKLNLLGLRMIPLRPQISNHSAAWKKLSSMDFDHMIVSSMTLFLFLTSQTMSSNRLV